MNTTDIKPFYFEGPPDFPILGALALAFGAIIAIALLAAGAMTTRSRWFLIPAIALMGLGLSNVISTMADSGEDDARLVAWAEESYGVALGSRDVALLKLMATKNLVPPATSYSLVLQPGGGYLLSLPEDGRTPAEPLESDVSP